MKEQMREALYRAAITCRHEITHEQIILYVDNRKKGNALAQLADRLEQAAVPAQVDTPKGKNDFGLDARYFHKKLFLILRDIGSYKPKEMYQELLRLANSLETIPADQPQQPAQEPCDMGEMCLDCQPRGKNGECPDQQPAQEPVKQVKIQEALNAFENIQVYYESRQGNEDFQIVHKYLKSQLGKEPVKQESKWISVEERLPDHQDSVFCVAVSNNGEVCVKVSNLNPARTGFYVEYDFGKPIERITHWMPIPNVPAPPVEVKE